MTLPLAVAAALLIIVAVHAWAKRLGVAAPLLLVSVGVLVSFIPSMPPVEVDPELVLKGVLPPLLYASAVSMPAMDFRRDFNAISGLSIALVVLSSIALGYFFHWLLPGVGLATGIALGAVASPTDAVATSIIKRLGAPARLVTVLEGESLLNDASALVLFRAAIAATAASVSFWDVAGDFLYAVAVAVVIGVVVARTDLRVRSRLQDSTASTAISFVAPFIASVPAEHLGASGLVAAVTAGLVTGHGAARYLRPQDRIATSLNWETAELLLEGAVFLLMGLQLAALIGDVGDREGAVLQAVWIGMLTIVLTLLVRTVYVAPLLWLGLRRATSPAEARKRVEALEAHIREHGIMPAAARVRGVRNPQELARRIARYLADVDYLAASPLRLREGAVLIWAGMRGAITLAAAQSLPSSVPNRSLLVLIAFITAGGSLLLQGSTLGLLVRRLGLRATSENDAAERALLAGAMSRAALAVLDDPALVRAGGDRFNEHILKQIRAVAEHKNAEADGARPSDYTLQVQELRLRLIDAQRTTLLDARDTGTIGSAALTSALDTLDADQISLELRLGQQGADPPKG